MIFIQNLIKKITKFIFLFLIFLFSILIFIWNFYYLEFFILFLKSILFYFIIYVLFIILPDFIFTKKKKIEKVLQGDLLNDNIYEVNGKYFLSKPNVETKIKLEIYIPKRVSGITKEDLSKIFYLIENKKIKEKYIKIVEHLSFGPYLFFGAILIYIIDFFR